MPRLSLKVFGILSLCVFCLVPAWSQQRGGLGLQEYQIGVDRDDNPDTGCEFIMVDGTPIQGVDLLITVRVQSDVDPPLVVGIEAQRCFDGSFAAPYPLSTESWPVGLNNGVSGSDVVEAFMPLSLLGVTGRMRLVAQSTSGTGDTDVIIATSGGQPILYTFPIPIPTLTQWGLILFLTLFTIAALVIMRRYRKIGKKSLIGLVLLVGLVLAAANAVINLDGNVGDWQGINPLADDPAGDSAFGDDAADLRALFGCNDNRNFFFRFDVTDLENQAPSADSQMVVTNEDTSLAITLTGSDPNGDVLSFSIDTPPANGLLGAITPLTDTSAEVTYTPNLNYNGPDSFAFVANDGVSNSNIATVDITVTPVNDCPIAVDDAVSTDEDTVLNGDVLAANPITPDSDPENDPITVIEVNGNPADVGVQIPLGAGLLTVNADGTFSFDPNAGYELLGSGDSAMESFTYTIDDGTGSGCAEVATATITINGVNDCPIAEDDAFILDKDLTLSGNVFADNGSGADSDVEGDPFSVVSVEGSAVNVGVQVNLPAGTLVTLNADGSFDYDPNGQFQDLAPGETAMDSFTYTIDEDAGPCVTEGAGATVTITITGNNDCPVAVDDAVSTDEDTILNGNVLAANPTTPDSDPEGDALVVTEVNGNAADVGVQIALGAGLLTVNADGTFSFDPNGGYESLGVGDSAMEMFTYTIDDGSMTCAEVATVTITINGVNDCSVAVNDAVSTDEDTVLNGDALAANPTTPDSDPEGDALTVTAVNGNAADVGVQIALGSGLLTVNANGTFSFDPNGGYESLGMGDSAMEMFTYTIDDGSGTCAETATVTITINGVNDCPVAVNDAVTTDEATVLNGDVLAANPTTPDSDPEGDGLVVTEVNGNPADVGVQIVLGSGLLTVNANGTFSFDPNGGYDSLGAGDSAMEMFTYTIDDGSGTCSETATVTITITGLDDCPVAVDDAVGTDEETVLNGDVLAANPTNPDSDPEGDPLTVIAVNGNPADVGVQIALGSGLLTVNANGTFSFDPNGGYESLGAGDSAMEMFTYTIDDGSGLCSETATVTVTINGVNDCPTAVNDAVSTGESTVLNGDVLAANPTTPDSDIEGDGLTVIAVNGNPADVGVQIALGFGLLTVNANGTFTFDPNGGYNSLLTGDMATEMFTYAIDDGSGTCSETATVTVTIIGSNSCPTAVNDAVSTDEDTVLNGDVLAANPTTPDSDPDMDTMTVTEVNGNAANVGVQISLGSGLLTVNANGTFSFDPNGGYESLGTGDSVMEMFTYTIDDGSGTCSETATVTVTINGVNDCPTAVNDAVSTDEDTVLNGDALVANPTTPDSDPEGDGLSIAAVNGNGANVGVQIVLGSGLLTVNANGTFSFDPNGGYDSLGVGGVAMEMFTYTIDDGSGGCAETATVTITINGVNDTPIVMNETFDDIIFTAPVGNTTLEFANASAVTTPRVFVSGDVLDNDSDPDSALSITVFDAASVQGGTVGMNIGTGEFTYLPPAGYEGADSFTYTVTDGSASAIGTVNLTVAGMVWYIDNNAGAGDGRSSTPFNSMADFNAEQGGGNADDPDVGDRIFIHESATTYTDGITLLDFQHLIGHGRALSVNGNALVSASTNPSLTNAAGDVVTLANDNIVEGLTLLPVASAGIVAEPEGMRTPENNKRFGTNTIIRFVTINPANASDGVEFNLRTGTLTFHDSTIQGLAGATGSGIVGAASNVILDFDDLNIQSPLAAGMDFGGMAGTMTATNVAIATDGPGISIMAGNMDYTFNGTSSINQTTGGSGVEVSGVTGGSLVFSGTSTINVANLGAGLDAVSVDAGGNDFDLTLRDLTIDASTGDDALVLANLGVGGTVAFAGTALTISGAGGRGIALNAVETVLSFPAFSSLSTTTGNAFEIIGGGADVTYPSAFSNASGRAINIDGRTGGTVSFNGTVTESLGGVGIRVANSAGVQTFADLDVGTGAMRLAADGILLDGNTGTINLNDISVFTNGGRGVVAAGGSPALNINPGGANNASVDTLQALALDISNAAMNAVFDQVIASNTVGGGVNLNNNTGTTDIALLTIANTGGAGLTATTAGTVNVTNNTSQIVTTNGPAIIINPTAVGMTFAVVTSTNSPAAGVSLTGLSGTLTMNGGSITGSTGTAFEVAGGNAAVTYMGGITNTSGRAVSVTGITGGSVSLSGNINETGTGWLIDNNTGGTTTLSGGSKIVNTGANTAVTLTSNAGHTTNITNGGLAVTTSGATGIDANNGGTVEILGNGNTISSTNGIAANIRGGTTIGGNGMTGGMNFLSISASGANNGIVLNGTGAGRFVVTGTGSTDASGGTLQNINNNGIELISANNISIANMDLLDANLTDNCGTEAYDEFSGGMPGNQNCRGAIYMFNVMHPLFTNITIDDTVDQGINGVGVTHFRLIDSEVLNAGNNNSESGILLRDLFGTVSDGNVNVIQNTTISDAAQIGVFIRNNLRTNGFAGEPDRLELTGSQFLLSAATDNGDNVTVSLRDDNPAGNGNGANFETIVSGCTFTGRVGASSTTDQIQVDAGINAKSQVSITGSTFTSSNTGINLSGADGSLTLFDVDSNPNISVRFGTGVNIAVNGTSTMEGTVSNNPIIDSDQPNNPAFGIAMIVDSNGSAVVDIDNNTVTDFLLPLRAGARGGSGTADVTVRNNDFTSSAVTGFGCVDLICGNGTVGETNSACFNISNNDAFDPLLQGEYFITMTTGTTCTIQGYAGLGTDKAAIEAFVDGNQNSGATTVCDVGFCGIGIINFTVGGTCMTP